MSVDDPVRDAPSLNVTITTGAVSGEVTGVKIGTLVSVYVFGGPGVARRPERPPDADPYKALDSYTFEDQDIFFGREALSRRICAAIRSHPTTALIGKAAIGKTSLIHAGLVPILSRDGDIAAFAVRDYVAPVAGVRQALQRIPGLSLALPEEETLPALLASFLRQTNGQMVIFFDQFERLFSLPPDQQDAFARQVVAAQAQDDAGRLHLVFVLRDSYRPAAADLQTRIPGADFLSQVHRVPGLRLDEAREAITRPLRVENGVDRAVFEEGLVDRWLLPQLDRLDGESDGMIEPAPLQIVCTRLYAQAQAEVAGSGRQALISLALYRQLGQARGILRSTLSEQKTALGVSDDDWLLMRRLLYQMAQSESLQFYALPDLAAAVAQPEAEVLRLLKQLQARRLVEARDEAAFALSTNALVGEIRTWFQDELDQERGSAALARAVADWDDQRLLTEPRRLRRIQGALPLLRPEPRAFALLLRSAVAYEAQPGVWLEAIAKDAPTLTTLQKLESGDEADPLVAELADVLGLQERGTFSTLGEAALRSPIEHVRATAALALSLCGVPVTLAALQPHLSPRERGAFRRAIAALAWMRFVGVPWAWPPLVVEPLVALAVLGLRLRANRVKIASVAASALVGTLLVGLPAAATPLLGALTLGFPVRNPALEFILLLGVEIALGGIVGLSYALADVITPPTRPGAALALRSLAIIAGFALANAFIVKAQTAGGIDPRALLVGGVMGSGFALAHEWAMRTFPAAAIRRVLLGAAGLALSTGLATFLTILVTRFLGLSLITSDSLSWRFAGGVNPIILLNLPEGLLAVVYVLINAFIGGIIGSGLAGGLVIGDRLAEQLERARYV